jgi:hypothetical protein
MKDFAAVRYGFDLFRQPCGIFFGLNLATVKYFFYE